ncbi:hypothetical protein PP727_20040 [Ralstonia solanacearum]|nr:hypothetical protein [Ralstonia solanacearum]MDC6212459.1 hypothetical protein [Ralstonia solanacearum]MDD7803010.1 hypothetical protein [Ralstonia solanacearum]
MSQRISILVALDGADEGLKRAITSAERSLGELAASAKTAGDRAAAGLAQVTAGVSVISEQISTARTQLFAFLSVNWTVGKVQEIVQGAVLMVAVNIGEHERRWLASSAVIARLKESSADVPTAMLVPRVELKNTPLVLLDSFQQVLHLGWIQVLGEG